MQFAAVKFSDSEETVISGLAAPFDGPFARDGDSIGRDLDGEFFTKATDFALDWYAELPLIFHHGHDPFLETDVVGKVRKRSVTDAGLWAEAQLDASGKYFTAIRDLIKKGKLYFSSGSVGHLVETDHKSGEILRWPMVEISLTPTPSNLFATVSGKAVWTTAFVNSLPDSAFLYIEDGGTKDDEGKTVPRTLRHFPYKDSGGKVDLPHLRNALARIPQSSLPQDVQDRLTKKAQSILAGENADDGKSAHGTSELRRTGGTGAAVATKTGRMLSKANETELRTALMALTKVLDQLTREEVPNGN